VTTLYSVKFADNNHSFSESYSDSRIWSEKTNAKQRGVDWQFRIEDARIKLKRLYPKIKV
jgi:hypothetical protein